MARTQHATAGKVGDLIVPVAEELAQHQVSVLAQGRAGAEQHPWGT